jgi:hypothetical protein
VSETALGKESPPLLDLDIVKPWVHPAVARQLTEFNSGATKWAALLLRFAQIQYPHLSEKMPAAIRAGRFMLSTGFFMRSTTDHPGAITLPFGVGAEVFKGSLEVHGPLLIVDGHDSRGPTTRLNFVRQGSSWHAISGTYGSTDNRLWTPRDLAELEQHASGSMENMPPGAGWATVPDQVRAASSLAGLEKYIRTLPHLLEPDVTIEM